MTNREKGSTKIMNDTSAFFGAQQINSAPRDQWGRYLLPDERGNDVGWTRATTFAAALAEQHGLGIWKQRQVVWGLARRPDLIEMAATISGPEDKRALGSIVDEAHVAAGTDAKANRGTALHKACEIADTQGFAAVPPQFQRDVAAYTHKLAAERLVVEPSLTERVVIVPEYRVAGTPDRGVWCPDGKLRILDIKTGNLDYAAIEFAVQLSLYAHATAFRDYARGTYQPMPDIATDYAIIAHIRPESGVCELHRVDIQQGWAWARLCAEVRDARKHKHTITPYIPSATPNVAVTYLPPRAAEPVVAEQHSTPIAAHASGVSAESDTSSFFASPFVESDDVPSAGPRADTINGALVAGDRPAQPEPPADPTKIDTAEIEAALTALTKSKLQQVARELMATIKDRGVTVDIPLNKYRKDISANIVRVALEHGVPIPDPGGSGAAQMAPIPQPGAAPSVDISAADRVAAARDAQWEATMFEAIRQSPSVGKLQVLREQAGDKWTQEMTESAAARASELDTAEGVEPGDPMALIQGATSRDTLSKVWSMVTQNGQNMAAWTPELDAAAVAKSGQLGT